MHQIPKMFPTKTPKVGYLVTCIGDLEIWSVSEKLDNLEELAQILLLPQFWGPCSYVVLCYSA